MSGKNRQTRIWLTQRGTSSRINWLFCIWLRYNHIRAQSLFICQYFDVFSHLIFIESLAVSVALNENKSLLEISELGGQMVLRSCPVLGCKHYLVTLTEQK